MESGNNSDDKKVKHLRSNVLQFPNKKKSPSVQAENFKKYTTNAVLKSDAAHSSLVSAQSARSARVDSYLPKDLANHLDQIKLNIDSLKREKAKQPETQIDNLSKNLGALKHLHARLRFMLTELEQLVVE